jgi:hypothetical protein
VRRRRGHPLALELARQAQRSQLREDTRTALFILDTLNPMSTRRSAAQPTTWSSTFDDSALMFERSAA